MTDAQKLEALTHKAFSGLREWDGRTIRGWSVDTTGTRILITCDGNAYNISPDDFLYNKEVARALFGDTTFTQYIDNIQGFPGRDSRDEGTVEMYIYEYRLQQAVISPNPIDYMYNAAFGDEK